MEQFCGVALRVLPDFLLDTRLVAKSPEDRLRELCARWVEVLQYLWPWGGSTMFCLRLVSQPARGGVGLFVLARPPALAQRAALQHDLETALLLFGLIDGGDRDFNRALPLLDEAALDELALPPGPRAALAREIEVVFAPALNPPLDDSCFVGVTQGVTGDLWGHDPAVREIIGDIRMAPLKEAVGKDRLPAWVPLSWEGPEGAFLTPFAALAGSRAPLRLSIYAQPTVMTPVERLWLERIASAALRDNNVAAALAARRSEAAVRRWRDGAFLVAAECAALDGDRAAATRLAQLVRSIALRPAEGDDAWPGVRIVADGAGAEAHRSLAFPHWMDDGALPPPLRRLSYLADARGAATLFRPPIGIDAGVPGMAVVQSAPDFNPGPNDDAPAARPVLPAAGGHRSRVLLGRFESGGAASVDLDDFTKHALITGFTGSGKTRTVLHLVDQLWAEHQVPVLILESAKAEYRGLIGVPAFVEASRPGLLVYTLGNDVVSPFRLNPFELIEGVRVESHVNRLKTCFEAAFPPFAPLSSIIEQSLIAVYREQGWMMSDTGPAFGAMAGRRWPDMTGFAATLEAVGASRGYRGENEATLLAATRGRVLPLTRAMGGSKGQMLDTQTSWPRPEMLFESPVVLEMNDLEIQDKALVSMFLLTLLREWREQQPRRRGLRHVTVIEEAHNVLAKVGSSGGQEGAGADTRFKAVEAFCTMLAEIRALGEGIVIADQSPEKLATDAMRNTNIQIAHQLRDSEDRDAVARAMIMSDAQKDFIGRLLPGRAAVFFTGLQRASFIGVPPFGNAEAGGRGAGFRDWVPDAELAAYMEPISGSVRSLDRPFAGCAECGSRVSCDFRWPARGLAADAASGQRLRDAFGTSGDTATAFRAVGHAAWDALVQMPRSPALAERSADAAWCWFLHMRRNWLMEYPPGGPFDRNSRGWFEAATMPELVRLSEEKGHE